MPSEWPGEAGAPPGTRSLQVGERLADVGQLRTLAVLAVVAVKREHAFRVAVEEAGVRLETGRRDEARRRGLEDDPAVPGRLVLHVLRSVEASARPVGDLQRVVVHALAREVVAALRR